jgi:Bacterial PH domain
VGKKKQQGERQEKPARPKKVVAYTTLFPEESVVMAATPGIIANFHKHVVTLGMYELWRRRNTAIVTDKRIMFGSGIVRRSEKSIPLSKVIDVSFSRKGLNSYAEVTVTDRGQRKNRLVGPMSGKEARRFVSEILSRT